MPPEKREQLASIRATLLSTSQLCPAFAPEQVAQLHGIGNSNSQQPLASSTSMTASSSFSSPRTADWHPQQQPWGVVPLPPHLVQQLPMVPGSMPPQTAFYPFGPGGPMMRVAPPVPVAQHMQSGANSPLKTSFSEQSSPHGPPPGLIRACARRLRLS